MRFLSRKKQFWYCQITGWFLLSTTNLLFRILPDGINWVGHVIDNFVFLLLGVIFSLILRVFYLKTRVIEKSLAKMIIPVLACSLTTTFALTFSMLAIISVIHNSNPYYDSASSYSNILSNLVGIYPVMLIWSCIYLCVQSLQRWKKVEQEKLALQLALKEAQLNTLIGQINPHFMFNSLNNIRALMLEDINQARTSITQLSNIIRHSLNADKQTYIALEQELEIIKEFAALSGIQYEERLKFKTDINEEALQIPIPPMLIQMLVENAIKHGISVVKGGGELYLSIKIRDNSLIVSVSNPGTLKPSKTSSTSMNIGLNNIRQRIQLLYGASAHFDLTEAQNKVTATLVLPM